MPPKKAKKVVIEEEDFSFDTPILLPPSPIIEPINTSQVTHKPVTVPMYMSPSVKNSDKIQLIQSINNFTLKGEELLLAMKKFDTFKEEVIKYDLLINTKKEEYNEAIQQIEYSYQTKIKNLNEEYNEHEKNVVSKFKDSNKKLETEHFDMNKLLQNKYIDSNKKLEDDYTDKQRLLANEYKNEQIFIKQKLNEFKQKACEDFLKDISMSMIKSDEYSSLQLLVSKTNSELSELKKSFDKECDKIRNDEKNKYELLLDNDRKMLKLTGDLSNADMKAKVEQQTKEIAVLKEQIISMKHELSEQRALTKDVALASSKSQISQSFGKN